MSKRELRVAGTELEEVPQAEFLEDEPMVSRPEKRKRNALPDGYRAKGCVVYISIETKKRVDARDGDLLLDLSTEDTIHLQQLGAIEPIWE